MKKGLLVLGFYKNSFQNEYNDEHIEIIVWIILSFLSYDWSVQLDYKNNEKQQSGKINFVDTQILVTFANWHYCALSNLKSWMQDSFSEIIKYNI